MSRIRILSAFLVIAALAVTGCTFQPSPAPSSSAAAEVPPPEPTPTETTTAQPEQLFGGDCDAAFDPAVITSIWGEGARLTDSPVWFPGVAEVVQLGGLSCRWSAEAAAEGADLTVIPTSSVAPEELGDPYCYGGCRFSVESAGLWLSGVVNTADGDEVTARGAIQKLTEDLAAKAASQPTVMPWPSGSWGRVSDCGALIDAADIDGAVGLPGISSGGNGPAEVAPGRYTAYRTARIAPCGWRSDDDRFGFTVRALSGAAWVEPDLRSGGLVGDASVAGAQSAFWSSPTGADPTLQVFADGNWMLIEPTVGDTPANRALAIRAAEALLPVIPRS